MARNSLFSGGAVVFAMLLSCAALGEDPAAPQTAQQPSVLEKQAPAAGTPAEAGIPVPAPTPAQSAAKPNPLPPPKKGKQPYTGPKDTIELPATPMLDEEGKQRLDFDGKPMFNPPVKQQRDKAGHPLFDAKGQPVFQTATDLGYDEKGHKMHGKKEKPAKTVSVSFVKGTLTVDGMIGKAALNYDVKDFKFVDLYAPWIGTVVVSNQPFPGSKAQANAFDQFTLTVAVEDHQFQVYSEKMILGKKPETAYVAVDRDFKLPTKYPVVGFGKTLKTPYAWPGAKPSPESKAYVKPPPLPVSLRPTLLLAACPPGQMRQVTKVSLPGDEEPAPPCVPIVPGKPGAVKPAAAATEATPAEAAPATSPAVPETVPSPPPA